MGKFIIQYNYNASIVVEVDAKDEGEALEKGRDIAEEADIKQFTICGERESQIIARDQFFIVLQLIVPFGVDDLRSLTPFFVKKG